MFYCVPGVFVSLSHLIIYLSFDAQCVCGSAFAVRPHIRVCHLSLLRCTLCITVFDFVYVKRELFVFVLPNCPIAQLPYVVDLPNFHSFVIELFVFVFIRLC